MSQFKEIEVSMDPLITQTVEVAAVQATHTAKIETAIRQLYKAQDRVEVCEGTDRTSGESFKAVVLCDGHGSNTVPNMIPQFAAHAATAESPCVELQRLVCGAKKLGVEQSGSTAIFAKVYRDRIMVEAVGDSTVIVLEWQEDSQEWQKVWTNDSHKWENPAERARLIQRNPMFTAEQSSSIRVVSPEAMCNAEATYVTLRGTLRKLATTQAIGHDDIYGVSPSRNIVPLVQGRKYKIVGGSDGVFDMVVLDSADEMNALYKMSAAEIVNLAESRWNQEWYPVYAHDPTYRGFPKRQFKNASEKDDVSCFVVDIDPSG
jgi:serine/threonine protein phosphatase PrpC